MTRKFWLGVMVSSLVISAAAAVFLYMRLNEYKTVEVPLETMPSTQDSTPPAQQPEEQPETEKKTGTDRHVTNSTTSAKEFITEKIITRNILFTLFSSSAKKVSLIGDFNNWYRESMTKRGKNKWEIAYQLEPGTYTYLYVVDDRRMKDPNNPETTEDGKSILVVDPLPK